MCSSNGIDDDEAERYTKVAEELAADDDLTSQALWRWVRAHVLARRGETEAALALAATRRTAERDRLARGSGRRAARTQRGRRDGRGCRRGACDAEAALRLYERKGDLVSAAKARTLLAELSQFPDETNRRGGEPHVATGPPHT